MLLARNKAIGHPQPRRRAAAGALKAIGLSFQAAIPCAILTGQSSKGCANDLRKDCRWAWTGIRTIRIRIIRMHQTLLHSISRNCDQSTQQEFSSCNHHDLVRFLGNSFHANGVKTMWWILSPGCPQKGMIRWNKCSCMLIVSTFVWKLNLETGRHKAACQIPCAGRHFHVFPHFDFPKLSSKCSA